MKVGDTVRIIESPRRPYGLTDDDMNSLWKVETIIGYMSSYMYIGRPGVDSELVHERYLVPATALDLLAAI